MQRKELTISKSGGGILSSIDIDLVPYKIIKKYILFFLLFFTGIYSAEAKTIWTCTYNTNPDSYDGGKYTLKIDDKYDYTFISQVFDHHKLSYGAGKEYKLYNWDDAIQKAIQTKEKCPPYLVNSPTNVLLDNKFYVYFNKEKAVKRKKEAFLFGWTGSVIDLVEEKDMRNKTDSKTDLEDKEDGSKDVENTEKDVIKEYKKTYPLSAMSSELNGKEYIFYTKYNHTQKQSLSTQITIKNNDKSVSLIYPGSIDDFNKNVIEPIVTKDTWPETFYCGELSTSLLVNPNTQVSVLLGTINIGDLVCSPDKNAFVDGTNKLSRFTTKYESSSNNSNFDRMPSSSLDPSMNTALNDPCSCLIINQGSSTYVFLKKVIHYIKIGSVFLVLVLGMVDMAGAVGSDEENAFKKAGGKFGKRLIAVMLIFLVPAMVDLLIGLMNDTVCPNLDPKCKKTNTLNGLYDE